MKALALQGKTGPVQDRAVSEQASSDNVLNRASGAPATHTQLPDQAPSDRAGDIPPRHATPDESGVRIREALRCRSRQFLGFATTMVPIRRVAAVVRRWLPEQAAGKPLSVLDGDYGRGLRVSGVVLLSLTFVGALLNLPFGSSELDTRYARASQLAALSGGDQGEAGNGMGPFGLRFGMSPEAVQLDPFLTASDNDPCRLPPAVEGTVLEKVAWIHPQLDMRRYRVRLDDRDIGVCGSFLDGTLAFVVMPYGEFRFMEHLLWRHLHEKYGGRDVQQRRIVVASETDIRRIAATVSRGVFSDAAVTIEMVKPVYTASSAEDMVQKEHSYLLYADNQRMASLATMAAEAARATQSDAVREYEQRMRERARVLRKF